MPMDKRKYPDNWNWLSRQIRNRNNQKCELCDATNGKPHWKTESIVVLTVHHIDGNRTNNSEQNLIALCQRCHLRLDLEKHIRNRQKTAATKKGGHMLCEDDLGGIDMNEINDIKEEQNQHPRNNEEDPNETHSQNT